MGPLEEIAREAGIPTRYVGSLVLIRGADALSFIDALATAGARILGIEGFDLEGSAVRPDMALIADFSSVIDPGESASEARRFIQEDGRPEAFYDFVIEGD